MYKRQEHVDARRRGNRRAAVPARPRGACLLYTSKLGDEKFEDVCLGDGPIDAAFQAIDRIVKPVEHTFELYRINSISQGKDTLGEVSVKLTAENRTFSGRGLSTDIIEASILAYISAVNKLRAYTARKNKEE